MVINVLIFSRLSFVFESTLRIKSLRPIVFLYSPLGFLLIFEVFRVMGKGKTLTEYEKGQIDARRANGDGNLKIGLLSLCLSDNRWPWQCANSRQLWTNFFLNRNSINVLDWPACSPDLNPIENIWSQLVQDNCRTEASNLGRMDELSMQTFQNHAN